ncbi:MAG: amidohydrolase family protein [Halanaerobiales bacterium]|nr:amidohydrolase family protein [Halanaerobiales bacterium]
MIIHGARYFDSMKMEFIEGKDIWIEDGLIKEIGKGFDNLKREVIDLHGRLLLPGWIDAHVHLTLTGSLDPIKQWQDDGVVFTAIKGATQYLSNHLRSGVTIVRDLGGDGDIALSLKKAVELGITEGPEIYTSGKALTMTGGHIYQISTEVDGLDEARKGAREELKKGVDLLKVIATGGILTSGAIPGSPQLDLDEIRIIVEEAHKTSRKVASHVEGTQGIKNSLIAGVIH